MMKRIAAVDALANEWQDALHKRISKSAGVRS
ncbi:3-alpha domain-containing protein [Sporosarcina sp. FSL W7-1349]